MNDAPTKTIPPSLAEMRRVMAEHRIVAGALDDRSSRAAVALILAGDPKDISLCLIRRAEHEDDPWSGQMALPGGRVDATDADPLAAAIRETWEEIGLRLEGAELLGPLSEMPVYARGADTGMALYSFLFVLAGEPPPLRLNQEVAEVYWLSLSHLLDPIHWDEVQYQRAGLDLRLPSIRCGEHHVWGLTYRKVRELMGLFGKVLPDDPFEARLKG